MQDNKLIERLLKMYKLATEGVDGEKENAQKLLTAALKKHGLTFADLERKAKIDEVERVSFYVKDNSLAKLLIQIVGVVRDMTSVAYGQRGRTYFFDLTKSQKIEVVMMYDFYKGLWKKELEKTKKRLFTAFISKHNIALTLSTKSEDKFTPQDLKEYLAISGLMEGLEDANFRKELGSGTKKIEKL